MLKLAIEAQLPLVAVNTRDTLNLAEVVKEVSKKQLVQFATNGPFGKNAVYGYVHQPDTKFVLPLAQLYEKMTQVESTLLIVNPPARDRADVRRRRSAGAAPADAEIPQDGGGRRQEGRGAAAGPRRLHHQGGGRALPADHGARFEPDRQGSDGDAEIQFPGLEGPDPGRRAAGFLQPARIPAGMGNAGEGVLPDRRRSAVAAARPPVRRRARHRQDLRREVDRRAVRRAALPVRRRRGQGERISARASRTCWRTSRGSTRPSPASS